LAPVAFSAFIKSEFSIGLMKNRLPSMHANVQHVEAGGLMSYTYDRPYQFRRAAEYVDKILKGAKPSDLWYAHRGSQSTPYNKSNDYIDRS